MAKYVVVLLLVCIHSTASAESFRLGIMVGANTAINQFDINSPFNGYDSKLGYNVNIFARLKAASLLFQPEFGYLLNRTGLTYTESGRSIESTLNQREIYASTLLGFKFGNIRIMGGPLFYSATSQDISTDVSSSIRLVSADPASPLKWGGQIGLGVDISSRWTIDVRFQKSLTKTQYQTDVSSSPSSFQGSQGALLLNIGYSILKL